MVTQAPEKVKVCDAVAHLLLFFLPPPIFHDFSRPAHIDTNTMGICVSGNRSSDFPLKNLSLEAKFNPKIWGYLARGLEYGSGVIIPIHPFAPNSDSPLLGNLNTAGNRYLWAGVLQFQLARVWVHCSGSIII